MKGCRNERLTHVSGEICILLEDQERVSQSLSSISLIDISGRTLRSFEPYTADLAVVYYPAVVRMPLTLRSGGCRFTPNKVGAALAIATNGLLFVLGLV